VAKYEKKKQIAKYVTSCAICQQVKVEHHKLTGPLQFLLKPQWKWENITMDFVSGLPKGKKGNDAIWVIRQIDQVFSLFTDEND
jgi:hypothetical protein